jgi:hypothetical protein
LLQTDFCSISPLPPLHPPRADHLLQMSGVSSDAKRAFSAISNISAYLTASRPSPAPAAIDVAPSPSASSARPSGNEQESFGDVGLCRWDELRRGACSAAH